MKLDTLATDDAAIRRSPPTWGRGLKRAGEILD